MGLFNRNRQPTFEQMDQQLARIPELRLGEVTFSAHTIAAGWRKNTPRQGVQLQAGGLTGWLDLEETMRFTKGTLSVHETWNGSPALLFISTPASASEDSAAGEALAGVASDHAGILHPGEDGELELVATLDPEQLRQLERWMRTFPSM